MHPVLTQLFCVPPPDLTCMRSVRKFVVLLLFVETLSHRLNLVFSPQFFTFVSQVFTGCGDAVARVYDAKSGAIKRTLIGHEFAINSIQVARCG